MKNLSKITILMLIFVTMSAVEAKAQLVLYGLAEASPAIISFQNPNDCETIELTILNDLYQTRLNSPILQVTLEANDPGEFTVSPTTIDLSTLTSTPAVFNIQVCYTPTTPGTHYSRVAIRGINVAGDSVILAYTNITGTN